MYEEAVKVVLESRKTSISFLQRKLRIGYNRAANLVEDMEKNGIVTAPEQNGQRQIIDDA